MALPVVASNWSQLSNKDCFKTHLCPNSVDRHVTWQISAQHHVVHSNHFCANFLSNFAVWSNIAIGLMGNAVSLLSKMNCRVSVLMCSSWVACLDLQNGQDFVLHSLNFSSSFLPFTILAWDTQILWQTLWSDIFASSFKILFPLFSNTNLKLTFHLLWAFLFWRSTESRVVVSHMELESEVQGVEKVEWYLHP